METSNYLLVSELCVLGEILELGFVFCALVLFDHVGDYCSEGQDSFCQVSLCPESDYLVEVDILGEGVIVFFLYQFLKCLAGALLVFIMFEKRKTNLHSMIKVYYFLC